MWTYLGIHVTIPSIITSVGKVKSGVTSESEAIVMDINIASRPVWCYNEHLTIFSDIDTAKTFGQAGAISQKCQATNQQELHVDRLRR